MKKSKNEIRMHRMHIPLKVLWEVLKIAQKEKVKMEFIKVESHEVLIMDFIYNYSQREIMMELIELVDDFIVWQEEKENGLKRERRINYGK